MDIFILLVTGTVSALEIFLLLNLIIEGRKREALLAELTFSFVILLYFLAILEVRWKVIAGICIAEYAFVKLFIILFMIIARKYCFYIVKRLAIEKRKHKETWFSRRYRNSKRLKKVQMVRKVKCFPRLKLGLPGMAYQRHAITKVKFDRNGFPKFSARYTIKLKVMDWNKTRQYHFYICNILLYEKVSASPELRRKLQLTKKDVILLSQGETPKKYVWHHHQNYGVMQLVDRSIHEKTYHIGGFSIWGGQE